MRNLQEVHRQELDDVLAAGRLIFCEGLTQTQREMFQGAYGGLFCEEGARFLDRVNAFRENKTRIPEVLAAVAAELEFRGAAHIGATEA